MENLKVDDFRRSWGQLRQGLDGVIGGKEALLQSINAAARTEQLSTAITADLDALSASLVGGQQAVFSVVANRLSAQVEVIARNAAGLASDVNNRLQLEASIDEAANNVSQIMGALSGTISEPGITAIQGDAAKAVLDQLRNNTDQLDLQVQGALSASSGVLSLARANAQMNSASDGLFAASAQIRSQVEEESGTPWWQHSILSMILLTAAIISALGYMLSTFLMNRTKAPVIETANIETGDTNQEAILRLLDEMGNLADGDLTVEATVTEDITGAIADSINYAIEALRELVFNH